MSGRGHAKRLAERLGARDIAILASLRSLRLLSGDHIRRLHFVDDPSQPATQARRSRAALLRLTKLGLVVRLRRRVGGVRSGSQGFVYALSGLGHAVLDLGQPTPRRHRRMSETKPAFQNHTLAVSDLYVQLVEQARAGQADLLEFAAEPRSWRSFDGPGQVSLLKPDAYVRLGVDDFEIRAFIEQDMDTESLPTIARKLGVYIVYWQTGLEQHREGVFPRTWWLVPTTGRLGAISHAIRRLPAETHTLFTVCLTSEAVALLTQLPAEGGAR